MLVESDITFSENVYKTHTIVSYYNLELERGKNKRQLQWQSKIWDEVTSWRTWGRESREEDAIAVQRRHNKDEETTHSGK